MPISAHATGTNPLGTSDEGSVPGLIQGALSDNTPAEFNHGMAKVPSMVIVIVKDSAAASAKTVNWDVDSSDGDQITLVSAGACDFIAVCLA